MPACPKCGKANPKRAKFCYDCGSPMYPPPTAPPTVSVQQAPKPAPTVRVISPTGTVQTPSVSPMPAMSPTRISMRIPSMGTCAYHRELPAMYICGRCSRSICKSCARQYLNMTFCSQCYGLSVHNRDTGRRRFHAEY